MPLYILFESSIGYGLFYLKEFDELSTTAAKIQKEIKTFETFSSIVQLKVLIPPSRLSSHSNHQKKHSISSIKLLRVKLLSSSLIFCLSFSPSRKNLKSNWASVKSN